jgi:hypothetical protein
MVLVIRDLDAAAAEIVPLAVRRLASSKPVPQVRQ